MADDDASSPGEDLRAGEDAADTPMQGALIRSARAIGIGTPLLLAGVALAAWALAPSGGGQGDTATGPVPAARAAALPVAPPPVDIAAAQTTALDTMAIDGASALDRNRDRPFDGKPEMPAAFRFTAGAQDRMRATDCLAAAAFYEAGADRKGQRAVAQVVLNRVRHPAYPKSVCDVVFEGAERETGCQFTFACDGAMRRRPSDAQWRAAKKVASEALGGAIENSVGTATHYHADYVVPYWSPKLQKIAQVGSHIFYRWPGSLGSRRVFSDRGRRDEPQIAQLAWFGHHRDAGAGGDAPPGAEPLSFAEMVAGNPAQPTAGRGGAATVRIVLGLDMKQPSGRWAIEALDSCGGRADCQFIGYPSGRKAEGRPAFLYIRDGNSGLDRALWDCRTVSRPSADQCLPEEDAAVRHLMRDRSKIAAG